MFSVYKGLILFILLTNAFALPIKRSSSDGKVVVFEKIKTVLSCTCYYEEGETLDSSKIDEYCDCVPEKVESDKSLVDKDNVEKIQESTEDSNLPDVQKYGSADADYFDNLDENEAKEEQEAEEEDKEMSQLKIDEEPNEEEITASLEDEIIEDIPEYNSEQDVISLAGDQKYIISTVDNNDDSGIIKDSEDILDSNGNPIHIEIEMVNDEKEGTGYFENTRYVYSNNNLNEDDDLGTVGEAYAEEVNDDDDNDDDGEIQHGFFENTRYIYNNNLGDDDNDFLDDDEELIGVAYAEEVNDDNDNDDNDENDDDGEDEIQQGFFENTRYIYNNNNLNEDDDLGTVGEAYAEEVNDDDDNDDDGEIQHGFFENTRYIYNNNLGDDDNDFLDDDEELIGVAYAEEVNDDNDSVDINDFIKNNNSKYLINNDFINDIDADEELIGEAYAEEANDDVDDEIDPNDVPSRPTILRAMKSIDDDNEHRKILEEFDEPIRGDDTKFVIDYYNENNKQNDEKDDDIEKINEDDDVRSIYKKLIIKKLKSDIKKMDSEKLIVDILKQALQGNSESSGNESLKNLLN